MTAGFWRMTPCGLVNATFQKKMFSPISTVKMKEIEVGSSEISVTMH
jgi:hypothetical protein